jgi:methylmalonyl-CoA mutase N-terminal domain/subunit
MNEKVSAKDPRSMMLRFHTQTAGCTLTAQQPYNNIVRVTIQALAAVLGGTQSLHTNSFDEAYATPSEEAVTIALRTQQLLAYESSAGDAVDPLGGSYYVESLTNALEEKARAYIDKINELGGAVKAIEQGYQQREIQENSYKQQKAVDEGNTVVVGVNKFISSTPRIAGLTRIDPEKEKLQKKRLHVVRQRRDNQRCSRALRSLGEAARGQENVMPAVLECVEAYASVGEICDVLRGVFGTQKEFLIF